MEIKGITIHNAGNDLTAREIYDELLKDKKMNICHFLVDSNEIINNYSIEYEASHTGRGYDFGNRYTIAIEICQSTSDLETYMKAEDNAVTLIKEIMYVYGLQDKDVYFHCDFNTVKCPHRTLEIYGTKRRFIDERII